MTGGEFDLNELCRQPARYVIAVCVICREIMAKNELTGAYYLTGDEGHKHPIHRCPRCGRVLRPRRIVH